MRLAWKQSEDEGHAGEHIHMAISCAEKAAPYIHARIQAVSLDGNVDTKVEGRLEVFWGGVRPPPEPEE